MRKIAIALLGAGGNCLDIIEALKKAGNYKIIGYLNPIEDIYLKKINELIYLGVEDRFNFNKIDGVIITFAGLGKNINSRKLAFEKYKNISPSFFFNKEAISDYCEISKRGVIIFSQVVIKSFCIVEENVFINSGSIIGHHTKIKKNTVISLGVLIGGHAVIGEEVFIGMGARIFQGVKIGKGSIIGAGVLVRKDLPPNTKLYKN